MEEKIIISAKVNNFIVGIFAIIIGAILMATCLVWETMLGDWAIFVSAGIGGIIALFGLVCLFNQIGAGIYVTDMRVYGKTLLGQRVDIPWDSISAVSLTSVLLYGISVSSSSGRITFCYAENRQEIYNVLSKLLLERQKVKKDIDKNVVANVSKEQSSADELKKFKDLLDSGVITQEEFDAKKKQLLGL